MSLRNPLLSITAAFVLLAQAAVAHAALPDFTSLVEQASPAVVNISTKQNRPTQGAGAQMPDLHGLPPGFREFFERGIPGAPGRGQQRPAQSLGSGFIISDDGYVLTNHHVIADADEIVVRLPDRSEMQATLVGADPRTDVALLKVDGKALPTVQLGDSNRLRAGEWVVAIGSPFGFDHTVTAGIVSATGRNLPSDGYVPFIQTDVAINPGNSGGPLFNLDGQVIGINSQIYTRSGGFMGVSFAIPISVAMNVADQLRETGRVSRGWLGVVIQDVNRDLAESFGLERPAGALIAQVVAGGPAEKGGLRVGDVILSVNGQAVVMSGDLPYLVGSSKPGTKVRLEVVRDGKRHNLDVAIGAMPDGDPLAAADAPNGAALSSKRLGVTVGELSAEQKQALGLRGGVMVREVGQGPAAAIGLRQGDVITHLNNQVVDSAKSFVQAAEGLPRDRSVSMRVLREGRASFITFRLPN
ncbi:DegQ family serine endoprotease [Stutzerimonas tarimensis]|uniref:Probable periplasmic serine endoprotease DegP-like n=1 Tax=Stutzerimonas tarimensis TaxID=1507735 RepID=A0ABV7T753_9GAMM